MMILHDEIIKEIQKHLPDTPTFQKEYIAENCAKDGEKNALLFRDDTAFELGGSGKSAVSRVLFCNDKSLQDEVLLFGNDLHELNADCAFAHFTFVSLTEQNEEALFYEKLTEIAFHAYRIYPIGYHIRMSPVHSREQVRVAKAAINTNTPLSFYQIGCRLIRELKTLPEVKSVTTVFITEPNVDYIALEKLAQKAKAVTDAVQSALQTDGLDCASCKMKAICDEVEGLRELHIKKEREKHEQHA